MCLVSLIIMIFIYGMVTQQSLNIYLSIVPDKSYFLAKKHGYLSMDYEKMAARLLPQPSCLKTVPWHRDLSQVFYRAV